MVKTPPAYAGDIRDTCLIPELGRGHGGRHDNPLNILAWRMPWIEEPGGLESTELQRAEHDRNDLACTHTRTYIHMYVHICTHTYNHMHMYICTHTYNQFSLCICTLTQRKKEKE